jgi:hypothetical protein
MIRRLGSIAGQSTDVPASAPTITSITPGDGFLNVNFTAPSSDGGREITNYQFSTNNGSTWTTRSPASASSPITISGLTNGITYSVVIRAINLEGLGATSNMVSAKPFTIASAPQSVSVTNGGGGGSAPTVSISFSAPFSNGGDNITNYQYSLNGGSTWITRDPTSTASPIVISGLSNSAVYSVGLRAVNSAGGGASSGFTSIRPLPHFTSASASTPAVADYTYITTQSSTYRTVDWSADPDNNFSAGTWRVRLLDGAHVVATSVNYTTTNATTGSFTISYADSAYWKALTVSFEITDSSSQTASTSTSVSIPAAETSSVTSWRTADRTFNGSFGTPGLGSTSSNKQSGNIPSEIYTTARAWDNSNGTQFRVDNINDVSGERHVETIATFIINESSLGTLVASDATSAGVIKNSSAMTIRGLRFRTGIRNTTHILIYDDVANVFRGSPGASPPPSGALLDGQATAYSIASENVIQDNTTWNSSGTLAVSMSRGGTTSADPYYDFNISVVQRRAGDIGRVILTDAQYAYNMSYQIRESFLVTTYR